MRRHRKLSFHSYGVVGYPSSIRIEPVRVEILEFLIRSTRKVDECVILKFSPLRFSDSEPRDPIFISLPCEEAQDQEGDEEEP